ncbi:histidinol dehydrogenase [Roseospira marina]|uniref:Histidinol dehydrogenase n=1 Tax=Roseospira marina TaxID=140057 RepID=A0A5M6IAF2_9PROT|nr:histidinol dehydrogenase [Roseospira marina]KAA5605256.1 histidinol dehydrogenase [Roseospira marina]MBB4314716.1 histidinol dehydrogenase [Roseospira marina]MBB5087705.1 histidinol dehydrogenase [Roseospira marina]
MPVKLNTIDPDFEDAFATLLAARAEFDTSVDPVVADILADVRARGDAAVIEYTQRFDRVHLTTDTLRLDDETIDGAAGQVDPETLAALNVAAERITRFHEHQKPQDIAFTDSAGVRLGQRHTAVDAVGLYVPGGTAAYPSSVLMNAIPAKVAGVGRLVMVVPTPDGVINPLVMAAARLAEVDEIYRIGGAQAVGALAYGTGTIAPVDKIVGPGNAYVASAKKQVFGTVGIDMIAGPSEILVVADGANDPAWIAADLLSQAEHDAAAQAIVITDDAGFAEAVMQAVAGHLKTLPRTAIAAESWERHGAVIVVEDLMEQAPPLVDQIAPEHLELAVGEPDALAARVRHAGAIFLGRHTPEAVGDYVGGPNHVLPTSRGARFSSGLGVLDFMKRTSLLSCDANALSTLGPSAVRLAEAEGLQAHGLSVAIRLNMARPDVRDTA